MKMTTDIQPLSDDNTPPSSALNVAPGASAPNDELSYEVCVVGGGLAGLCAALSSARMGVRTVLIQDRAVLGAMHPRGNSHVGLGRQGP